MPEDRSEATMSRVTASATAPRLKDLVVAIREGVRIGTDPRGCADRAATALRPFLADSDLLLPEHREPDPARYRQSILHVEDDGSFSVVALIWLPGQATPVHDHVSWCVVGVYEGQEHETRYRISLEDGTSYLVEAGEAVNREGSVTALTPPGDIHRVENRGPGAAISLHVYGADIGTLGSSIRRTYDLEIKHLTGPWNV